MRTATNLSDEVIDHLRALLEQRGYASAKEAMLTRAVIQHELDHIKNRLSERGYQCGPLGNHGEKIDGDNVIWVYDNKKISLDDLIETVRQS